MNYPRLTSASFAIVLFASATPALSAATLVPHRAFYDLEVKRLDQGSNIAAIAGKLAYEITGSACEGYAVSYRIANRVRYAEGGVQVIDTQLASWESGDGLEVDLTQKQFLDAKLSSESRIKVKKAAQDAVGKGEILLPVPKLFETDAKAVFPTAYQIHLLDVALAGAVRDDVLVYEGSDDEKSMRAISFIGTRKDKGNLMTGADSATIGRMNALPSWPVTISYYAAQGGDDVEPLYQASFIMLENGISTDLVMDYGTYALKGRLSKLEMLKSEPCE